MKEKFLDKGFVGNNDFLRGVKADGKSVLVPFSDIFDSEYLGPVTNGQTVTEFENANVGEYVIAQEDGECFGVNCAKGDRFVKNKDGGWDKYEKHDLEMQEIQRLAKVERLKVNEMSLPQITPSKVDTFLNYIDDVLEDSFTAIVNIYVSGEPSVHHSTILGNDNSATSANNTIWFLVLQNGNIDYGERTEANQGSKRETVIENAKGFYTIAIVRKVDLVYIYVNGKLVLVFQSDSNASIHNSYRPFIGSLLRGVGQGHSISRVGIINRAANKEEVLDLAAGVIEEGQKKSLGIVQLDILKFPSVDTDVETVVADNGFTSEIIGLSGPYRGVALGLEGDGSFYKRSNRKFRFTFDYTSDFDFRLQSNNSTYIADTIPASEVQTRRSVIFDTSIDTLAANPGVVFLFSDPNVSVGDKLVISNLKVEEIGEILSCHGEGFGHKCLKSIVHGKTAYISVGLAKVEGFPLNHEEQVHKVITQSSTILDGLPAGYVVTSVQMKNLKNTPACLQDNVVTGTSQTNLESAASSGSCKPIAKDEEVSFSCNEQNVNMQPKDLDVYIQGTGHEVEVIFNLKRVR